MKVFIHLDRGREDGYLLTFPKTVTAQEIKGLMEYDYVTASYLLMVKSQNKVLISPHKRKKARLAARFTLTEGYSAERLV